MPLPITDYLVLRGAVQEIVATITSKGQVTIPVQVRRHLKLKQHDKIAFVIAPEGTVTVQVPDYPTIDSLRGAAGTLSKPLSWKEVEQIARDDYLIAEYPTTP